MFNANKGSQDFLSPLTREECLSRFDASVGAPFSPFKYGTLVGSGPARPGCVRLRIDQNQSPGQALSGLNLIVDLAEERGETRLYCRYESNHVLRYFFFILCYLMLFGILFIISTDILEFLLKRQLIIRSKTSSDWLIFVIFPIFTYLIMESLKGNPKKIVHDKTIFSNLICKLACARPVGRCDDVSAVSRFESSH